MATGTTNAISKDSGITTQIRLYYSTTFNASTSTSTVSLIPQVYSSANLGGDVRFYAGGVSGAAVYGGSSTNTSNLYTLSGNYGSGQYLIANNTSWGNLNPYTGSISTFTIKHGKDGKATFYGGVVGKVITMYDYSTSTYSNTSSNKSGCSATITVSAPYSISYNANGGSGAPASQAVFATYSYNLSSTTPTRDGYNFLGWSTSSSASTATYTPGQSVTITGNLPLYAVWSLSEKTVFLSAGANILEVEGSGSYTPGQTVSCVALTEKDPNYIYTFSGWYNGDTLVSSDNPYTFSMGDDNISLEARASKTKVDVPSISSITIPNGDVYAVKDAYAREIIEKKGIVIQDDEPTHGELVWIDTDDPGTQHIIPEIDDSTTSADDTWSSQKIASQSDMETLSLSWSLLNCSGTMSGAPDVKLSKDGKYLWFSGRRITITSYSRGSGGNPGIKTTTDFRPSGKIVVYCGVRVDNTTFRPEAVYIELHTTGELNIRVNESYSNATSTPLHLMMTSCIIPLN